MPDKNVKQIKLEEVEVKSAAEHAFSATKYVASAATVATAVVGIVVFARPEWKPIESYMLSLLTVVLNVGLVFLAKKSD